MAFLDKFFRWKKKPFGTVVKEQSAKSQAPLSVAPVASVPAKQGTGRYAQVLVRPHISEKSASLQGANQYIFEVGVSASKGEVLSAVEELFGVRPIAVNTTRRAGKAVRFGRSGGKTKAWKKAIVTLPAGKTIDVYKK